MRLIYEKGTIAVYGHYNIPNTRWDERSKSYRAQAFYYRDILNYLKESGIPFEDHVLDPIPMTFLKSHIKLRDYQKEAVERWMEDKKGIVVMPTGSGKTTVAIRIIETMNTPSFIVVPTLDLVDQWKEKLKIFNANTEIGELTGRRKELKAITVSTYDSAYLNADTIGNRFMLLIFDEVHHLPAVAYRQIAEMFASPYRLGLTATYVREDGYHLEISKLIGGIVYEKIPEDLKGKYLADYEIRTIKSELTEKERIDYERYQNIFTGYLRKKRLTIKSAKDFGRIVILSGRDRDAREALLARNMAERICFNSENKIEKIRELLSKDNRTIIFTRYNDMAYEISRRFFIPVITYRTDEDERREIMERFRKGVYRSIVSSQVLDEGIDVPEANVGVVLSGTGSSREFIQRLGRLLRPKEGKKAALYEIITRDTKEITTSKRRKNASGRSVKG
jgi:superfamily II DNA or RNA helicase